MRKGGLTLGAAALIVFALVVLMLLYPTLHSAGAAHSYKLAPPLQSSGGINLGGQASAISQAGTVAAGSTSQAPSFGLCFNPLPTSHDIGQKAYPGATVDSCGNLIGPPLS